jgi:hypothetical protein
MATNIISFNTVGTVPRQELLRYASHVARNAVGEFARVLKKFGTNER